MQKRRIKCDYDGCGRSYCSYFNLKRHIESSHLGLRKFKCDTCGRYLSSKQNYVDHQNIHTGAKPYICDFSGCSLRFRQLSQYYLHKQLHGEISIHAEVAGYSEDSILLMLGKKLSEESQRNYNIPLIPYSLDTIHLPEIINSQEFHIPQCSILFQQQSLKEIA
ncbi:hypothetical protein SteCoe_35870 [Stentor coeruleus]|uniref:C2H2-type domain-containing protein n=1 Tax=Stentor coeruleus TaxID=5963 RepID=A0A1R2ARA8_9CILI|nr:hypothetical protein SteCoe_35870 [Stentor coeruleus]